MQIIVLSTIYCLGEVWCKCDSFAEQQFFINEAYDKLSSMKYIEQNGIGMFLTNIEQLT